MHVAHLIVCDQHNVCKMVHVQSASLEKQKHILLHSAVAKGGAEGGGGRAPQYLWRDEEKRVTIGKFPIYKSCFLKLDTFAAILRNEKFKEFQEFFLRTP